jgi:hypothetical protein
VTIGTGFGAYFYLDGKLYGGKHGFAGNIGHNTIDEVNGYPCGCGRKGCLEIFVVGPAIARAGQAALERAQPGSSAHPGWKRDQRHGLPGGADGRSVRPRSSPGSSGWWRSPWQDWSTPWTWI